MGQNLSLFKFRDRILYYAYILRKLYSRPISPTYIFIIFIQLFWIFYPLWITDHVKGCRNLKKNGERGPQRHQKHHAARINLFDKMLRVCLEFVIRALFVDSMEKKRVVPCSMLWFSFPHPSTSLGVGLF